jgi:hypothetical protein
MSRPAKTTVLPENGCELSEEDPMRAPVVVDAAEDVDVVVDWSVEPVTIADVDIVVVDIVVVEDKTAVVKVDAELLESAVAVEDAVYGP